MKKSVVIILVIFLFACKNNDEKMDTLDFCVEQSENIISNQNKNLLNKFKGIAVNDPVSSVAKFQYRKANEAYKLSEDFEKKIIANEDKNNNSLLDLNNEFNKYLDTLLAISSNFDYFIKSEIVIEKFRKMKITDTRTCLLISTILLNEFLQELMKMSITEEFNIHNYGVRIVPTKDNYKVGDNIQILFSSENINRRLAFNFTHFTKNGIPLNIKDLNYDIERRMIDFKIKEKGLYKIKGYELVSMSNCYENVTDTLPFETEYEVK
jgi:hypothetical protein